MRAKKLFALLLAGSMMASVLTGCWGGGKDDNASSGTDGDSDITWTDPDYDEDEVDPTEEHTIAVDAGENATVDGKESPVKLTVKDGKDVSFVIKAADGYVINAVKIDGETIDKDKSDITGTIPGEQVTVTLKNVSTNHEVTATCVKRTYRVYASEDITVTSGDSVEAGGTVTFTVNNDPTYDVAVSVTVGDSSAKYDYNEETQVYTVTDVNGDVNIDATFTPSPVSSVTIKPDTDSSTTSYKIGEAFKPNMTVIVTYKNGYSTQMDLNEKNTSVEPATVNAETESVTITAKSNSDVTITYSFAEHGVTVTVLSGQDVTDIKTAFGTTENINEKWSKSSLTVGDDDFVAKVKVAQKINGWIKIDGKWYTYDSDTVENVQNVAEMNAQIQDFYDNTVNDVLYYNYGFFLGDGYHNGTVCIDVDQETGDCTMWVIEGYPAA